MSTATRSIAKKAASTVVPPVGSAIPGFGAVLLKKRVAREPAADVVNIPESEPVKPIVMKREADEDGFMVPPVPKKSRAKKGAPALKKTASAAVKVLPRTERNDAIQKKFGVGVFETLRDLVGDEVTAICDSFPRDVSPEAIKGVISLSFRRIMIKHMWLTSEERHILVRLIAPTHWQDCFALEQYATRFYSRAHGTWRKPLDELAIQILTAFTDAGCDASQIASITMSQESFAEEYEMHADQLLSIWKYFISVVATGQLANTVGLGILQNEEFREFASLHFKSFTAGQVVPPLANNLPVTAADWAKYTPAMTHVNDAIKELVSDNRGVPTVQSAKAVLDEVEIADPETFEDMDECTDEIEITEFSTERESVCGMTLPAVPDQLRLKGGVLAGLSTRGHVEYVLCRLDVEHDYVARKAAELLSYKKKLEHIKKDLRERRDEREAQLKTLKELQASNVKSLKDTCGEVVATHDRAAAVRREHLARLTGGGSSTGTNGSAQPPAQSVAGKTFRDLMESSRAKSGPAADVGLSSPSAIPQSSGYSTDDISPSTLGAPDDSYLLTSQELEGEADSDIGDEDDGEEGQENTVDSVGPLKDDDANREY